MQGKKIPIGCGYSLFCFFFSILFGGMATLPFPELLSQIFILVAGLLLLLAIMFGVFSQITPS